MKVEGEVEIVQIVSGRVTLSDKQREDKKKCPEDDQRAPQLTGLGADIFRPGNEKAGAFAGK